MVVAIDAAHESADTSLRARMLTFLLVSLLAVGLVLGPVFAMQPSPRQRQLERMRAKALECGLRVRLPSAANAPGATGRVIDYLLPWQLADLAAVRVKPPLNLKRQAGDIEWRGARSPLPDERLRAVLARLPDSVNELGSSVEGLFVRWLERGEEQEVERIAEVLRALREALLSCYAPADRGG